MNKLDFCSHIKFLNVIAIAININYPFKERERERENNFIFLHFYSIYKIKNLFIVNLIHIINAFVFLMFN